MTKILRITNFFKKKIYVASHKSEFYNRMFLLRLIEQGQLTPMPKPLMFYPQNWKRNKDVTQIKLVFIKTIR